MFFVVVVDDSTLFAVVIGGIGGSGVGCGSGGGGSGGGSGVV